MTAATPPVAAPTANAGPPCASCGSPNRRIAKYCKGCGERRLSDTDAFAGLFGLDTIAAEIRRLLTDAVTARSLGQHVSAHHLILGPQGAGASRLARAIAECAEQVGLTKKGATIITARELKSQKPDDLLSRAAGGTLIVDSVDRLLPNPSVAGSGDQSLFDLLDALAHRGDGSDPLVVVTGHPGPYAPYVRAEGALSHQFRVVRLDDWPAAQLADVVCDRLDQLSWSTDDPAVRARIEARCRHLVNQIDHTRRHGHAADELVQQVTHAARTRLNGAGSGAVIEADIPAPVDEPVTLAQLFAELDGLQGIEAVREQLHQIIRAAQDRKAKDPKRPVLDGHMLLMGNAGTGKTTIAKLLPRLLCKAGILPSERLVEITNPASLQAGYIGQTSGLVNDAIDRARGGVLFIDEAHQMADVGGHNYQRELLNTLLPRLENERGQFLCVLGGYTANLPALLAVDQGMQSRFPEHYRVQLHDYSADTLASIFLAMAADARRTLTPEAERRMRQLMRLLRRWSLPAFSNARGAREFLSACLASQVARVGADPTADATVITEADIALPRSATGLTPEAALADSEAQLDALVGQPGLADVINRLRGNLLLWRAELEDGTDMAPPLGHILLLGSPGTGKTTVARLMGKLLYGLGMLPRPHVEEVRGTELIKGIQGAAAQAVRELVDRAIGGVLFLDEVSGLLGQSQGLDVVRELLPHLVDAKGRFVMIVAGYPHVVDEFLRLDDGLARRFDTVLELEDYSAEQVHAITVSAAQSGKPALVITDEASDALLALLRSPAAAQLLPSRNAGMAQTLVTAMRDRVATRLMARLRSDPSGVTIEERRTVLREDVPTGFDSRGNAC